MTGLVSRLRRRNNRKIAKLVRALASLDEPSRAARTAPRRAVRVTLGT